MVISGKFVAKHLRHASVLLIYERDEVVGA